MEEELLCFRHGGNCVKRVGALAYSVSHGRSLTIRGEGQVCVASGTSTVEGLARDSNRHEPATGGETRSSHEGLEVLSLLSFLTRPWRRMSASPVGYPLSSPPII